MLAIATNFLAFYIGVIFFERMGVLCGVAVFLVLALAGTIMVSMIDEHLQLIFAGRRSDKAARPAARCVLP